MGAGTLRRWFGGLRVEMQPELPWNVAGIPPEAREAARAAARREGLSVGEWLTRRILRNLAAVSDESDHDSWRPSFVEPPRMPEPAPRDAGRDSEDMLARVSRSEAETQNAYRAIDQQLKAVARRLEGTERTQTENNRAMTQAATQINVAAREQAQAFEQMSAKVTTLAERLGRVERQSANDGMKEAVKALHQGLSRVADQISQTANQSASQIAALAGNMDALATQVADAHAKADAALSAGHEAVEQNFVALDERLRVVERTAFSSASAIDHTMEHVEQLKADKDGVQNDVRQHAAAVAQVKDVFDHLNDRIAAMEKDRASFAAHASAAEDENAAAIARLTEAVNRLEDHTASNPVDRRLQSIEHVLSDMMSRMEHSERANATSNNFEQALRDVAAGFESAERRNNEIVRELQAAMQETADKIAAVESRLAAPPKPEPAQPAHPIFDAPSFENDLPPTHAADFASAPAFAQDLEPPPFPAHAENAADYVSEEAPAFGEPFGEAASPHMDTGESFLTAARRSARAAAAEADQQPPPRAAMGGFSWTFGGKAAARPDAKRYVVAGSVFGVAVAAALAGVVLTHSTGSPSPQTAAAPPTIGSPFAARPSLAPPKPTAEDATPTAEPTAAPDETASAPAPTATAAVPQTTTPMPTRAATAAPKQIAPAPAAVSAATPAAPASPMQKLASLANTGDAKAQLLLGLDYLEGKGTKVNEAEATRWLARSAQQGEALAQYRLGTLYERGRGVPADAKQATRWYELAAKQGNRKAMHNLAVAYAEGSGEPKDYVQAATWFARAANLGLADSQFNLAVLYERGMGVQQSLADAYKWYLIAGAQGDAESKKRADALSTQLNDTSRSAGQAAAAAFKPQQPNPAANTAPVLG
jgi:localization factor PodJL